MAVEKGLYRLVEILIEQHQVDVNAAATSDPNEPAYTPLHLAVLHNQLHIVPLLMRAGESSMC